MIYLILIITLIVEVYFVVRYFLIKHALRESNRELKEIQQDFTQNQILHLPIPDQDLAALLESVNHTLEAVRLERQSYERLEKEFKEQIENISHDLRTPLTVILGYLKFIKKSGIAPIQQESERMEALEIIERKARSMENLVEQFYIFSRINAKDYEISMEEVDVSRILRETLMDNYRMFERSCLKIDAMIPDHPIWAEGDERSLERIFTNLLQNASRYASTFLKVQIEILEEEICIVFENDTNKMEQADVSHLFDRFYMQDSTRNQGGTGLGLTVAKQLAEEMEGSLGAEALREGDEESIKVRFTLKVKNGEGFAGRCFNMKVYK